MAIAISLVGLGLTFLGAWGLDKCTAALQQNVVDNGAVMPYLGLSSLFNLVLAAGILLLAWYVIVRAPKNAWVAGAYVLLGLLVTFATAIIYSMLNDLPTEGFVSFLRPTPRVAIVGAFAAAAGLWGLVRALRWDRDEDEDEEG